MLRRLSPFLDVKVGGKIDLAGRELLKKPVNVAVDLRRHAIDFHPVASGEQDDFIQASRELETAPMTAKPRRMHGQLFAQFDGRGLVAESGNEEFHAAAVRGELRRAEEDPGIWVWPNLAICSTNSGRRLGITRL